MRTAIALLLAVVLSGCCTAPKLAVKGIEETNDIILPRYLKYVDTDPALSADQRDDQKKLVESLRSLIKKLRETSSD